MLQPNHLAPSFTLIGDDNKQYRLTDFKNSWVVLYFYPKDDTLGCAEEAIALRDSFTKFEKINTYIIGISPDSIESHQLFKQKYNLPFILLSNSDMDTIQDYNAQTSLGVTKRMTYIINPEGKIAKVYHKVEPKAHAEQLLLDIEKMQ